MPDAAAAPERFLSEEHGARGDARRAGHGRCQRVDLAELARSFALGYVEQVRAWAEGAPPEREAIARWGLALLDHLVGPDDPAGVRLRESLKGLLPEPP